MLVHRISNSRKAACVNKCIQTESITTMRRWYTTTYGETALSANSIKGWYRSFLENGTVDDLPWSGRPEVSRENVRRIELVLTKTLAYLQEVLREDFRFLAPL